MKTIRLLKNSILHLVKCEKAALVMIVFSLFCIYFSQFGFSGVMNHLFHLRQASSNYTSICITPTEDYAGNTLAFFESSPLGEMHNAFVVDLDTTGNRPQMVGWKGTAFTRWEALEAGMSFFSAEQVESNERIAIMSVTSLGARPASRTINETSFAVIEHGSLSVSMLLRKFPTEFAYYVDEYGNDDELIVPYRTFFEEGFIPDAIVLDMREALSGNDQQIFDEVSSYFPNCEIYLVGNSSYTQNRTKEYEEFQLVFSGMSVLSALSIFTFFNGWIRHNARKYHVYMLCGASKVKVFWLVLLEWSTLTLLSSFCAWGAIALAMPRLNALGFALSMSPIDYWAIIATGLMISYASCAGTLHSVCCAGYRGG